jgi:hypothetical protein
MLSLDRVKAQTSVEFLVVLAVGIAIITGIMLLASDQAGGLSSLKEQNDAKNAVLDLSAAAKDVHSQGEGARKDVYIVLPSSYEPSESYVGNSSIRLRARGSDFAVEEEFDVYGSLPNADGAQWVTVSCEGDRVRIGTRLVTMSKNSIYIIMKRNSSRTEEVTIESFSNKNISVGIDISWSNTDVSMSTSSGSFKLESGEEHDLQLGFSTNEYAIGFYNGEIRFNVTDGTESETIKLPITVKVLAAARTPPLTIIPGVWNESIQPGQTKKKMFTLCTNEFTILSGVTFWPSLGVPGGWIGHTSELGPLSRGSCSDKMLSVSVPVATEPGFYTGSLQAIGKGVSSASDTVALEFRVGGDPNDARGPKVTSVTQNPSKVYTGERVKFIITASDRYLGNNTIQDCEYKTNETDWASMAPLDGRYNTIIEKAKTTYSGFSTKGVHNISFRCMDSYNNIGPVRNHTVKVMSNFLFVTKMLTPTGAEQEWMSWLDNHTSDMGYSYDYETADDNDVADGLVDTSYYGAILMADYKPPSGIRPALQTYTSNGGRVVLLGNGFQHGPRDLGHSGSPGTSGNSNSIYIISNLHYITSDYSDGETVTLFTATGTSGAVKNYLGTEYASEDSTQVDVMLGEYAGVMVWGPDTPQLLNADGNNMTKKVMDYALLQSTINPW